MGENMTDKKEPTTTVSIQLLNSAMQVIAAAVHPNYTFGQISALLTEMSRSVQTSEER